ncbi:MAG: prephenate dehydrogenase/arogenate dehydrogenase family protein [Zoogloeaceae bacterium]|nr:prephenate dehydrogenase/arogenate dehydrogenase family protein [Zoogloeaceae bacterium]
MREFGKIVIYGVGLIGGSFARALKAAGAVDEVVGFGRRPENLTEAVRLGVIDRVGTDPARELPDADLVLVATPVGQMSALFAQIAPHLGERTLITDGGSTKRGVVAAARAAFSGAFADGLARFVPAHPIAGTENSGAAAARADLFQGRKVVLTPTAENHAEAVARVQRAWTTCGAEVCRLTPEQHDRVFAAVSHLPHLLAFALVRDLAERPDAPLFFDFAASGFRDFTRIAASHPEMWRDICLDNREALLAEIETYAQQLREFKTALRKNDGAALETRFAVARAARRAWSEENIRQKSQAASTNKPCT